MDSKKYFWINPSGSASHVDVFGGYHVSAARLIEEHLGQNGYNVEASTDSLVESCDPSVCGLYKVESYLHGDADEPPHFKFNVTVMEC